MYVKPGARQSNRRSISVPQNYSGNAFSSLPPKVTEEPPSAEEVNEEENAMIETDDQKIDEAESVAVSHTESSKGILSGLIGNDELIILGIILLLSQDDSADDILPILLLILFLRK